MEDKFGALIGAIFIVMSGLIYTIERGFTILSTNIVKSGFYSGGMTGEVPEVETNNMFDNLYVPGFLLIGILLLIYSFMFTKK